MVTANEDAETGYILYLPPLLDPNIDSPAPSHTSLILAPSSGSCNVTISMPLMAELVPLSMELPTANWTEAELPQTWLDMSRDRDKGKGK